MRKASPLESGQSLFEVVLALSVIALIIIAVVILATLSIRNSDYSRNKTLATRYSQEALEWLRGQRDTNWSTFYGKAGAAPNGSTWCLNTEPLPQTWTIPSGSCTTGTFITTNNVLVRNGVLIQGSVNGSPVVYANVKVSWSDGSGTHEVSSVTTFTNYRAK